jgi:hypothetical protein
MTLLKSQPQICAIGADEGGSSASNQHWIATETAAYLIKAVIGQLTTDCERA